MLKIRARRLTLAVLCALPLAAAAQEGLKLRQQPNLMLLPTRETDDLPLFIEADELRGHPERELEAQGNVRIRKRGQAIFGDWIRYDKPHEDVIAIGKVRVEQGADVLEGQRLRYNLATDQGFLEGPDYVLRPPVTPLAQPAPGMVGARDRPVETDARGKAERIIFEGPQQLLAENGQYTTCGPGNDDWYIRARELQIDKSRDIGYARGASIVFMDQTLFYSPYMSFSLHQQRKSGFLTPHYGSSNTSGFEFTTPYYWNIAPNMDATFYPRLMTKRGMQLSGDTRYMDTNLNGTSRFEWLPSDQQTNQDRWAYFIKHTQRFGRDWNGMLNLNRVSDGKYFTDLSTLVAVTSQATLPQEGSLSRGGSWGRNGGYTVSAMSQHWQTLQSDPLQPITPPYNREQLALSAFHQDVYRSDFDVIGSFVSFDHPTLVTGRRAVAYPSFSVPLQNAYGYITPKAGVHTTAYAIDSTVTTGSRTETRALPVFTTESGVVMERNTRLAGTSFLQTLEPKLYYAYIPYRDQSTLPNFDSALQDINFATIYAENQFSGNDRINDANQMTVGLTSRLIHEASGIERVRAGLAQRYYFSSQKVTVPGVAPRPPQSSSSDLLAALSGTVAPHVVADAGWQVNTDTGATQRLNVGARYQPELGKVLNLSYRFTDGSIKQTDMSFQWPVTREWAAVGRWNWSLQDNRLLEGVGGLEYDGGCWIFRAVAHRFATTTQAASTSVFFQLELNGVSRIGSNPIDILRRNVGGYARLDPRAPRRDDYYLPDR